MDLSKRLSAVASFVTPGYSVADIGTDHGYISIYLAGQGSRKIIAMDINAGPLQRAEDHIRSHHLETLIETRISDGLQALKPGEVQAVVMAGMGGALVLKILADSPAVTAKVEEFILQPQSEIAKVRAWLWQQGFIVQAEDMVKEDGKYYPVMFVKHGWEAPYTPAELRYGRCLLQQKHPILQQFIASEIKRNEQILSQLSRQQSMAADKRKAEIETALADSRQALERISE
ncbi:MAG: tRNA (adenine(22)-N(1))-methyltransferase [Lachnospiraceae bacterium]